MGDRQYRHRLRLREQLLDLLGRRCSRCGALEENTRLEVDHPFGRDWEPRNVASTTRYNRYIQEAKEGKVRLLCAEENSSRGGRIGANRRWCGKEDR